MKISRQAPELARTMTALDPYRDVLRADPCAYCGDAGGTLDHIHPIACGGADTWANLTGACGTCNGAKATRSLLLFLVAPALPCAPVPPRSRRALVPEPRVPSLRWSLADALQAAGVTGAVTA